MEASDLILPANCSTEEHVYLESYPCPCGSAGYGMVRQELSARPNGVAVSEIIARCSNCNAEHTFFFDVSQSMGKAVPEKPSQLFDLAEWITYLLQLMHTPPAGEEGPDLMVRMRAWVAVEQALLFFDEGDESPRPGAFFHTPEPPEALRPYLSRQFLEPLQARMRAHMGWPPEVRLE